MASLAGLLFNGAAGITQGTGSLVVGSSRTSRPRHQQQGRPRDIHNHLQPSATTTTTKIKTTSCQNLFFSPRRCQKNRNVTGHSIMNNDDGGGVRGDDVRERSTSPPQPAFPTPPSRLLLRGYEPLLQAQQQGVTLERALGEYPVLLPRPWPTDFWLSYCQFDAAPTLLRQRRANMAPRQQPGAESPATCSRSRGQGAHRGGSHAASVCRTPWW